MANLAASAVTADGGVAESGSEGPAPRVVAGVGTGAGFTAALAFVVHAAAGAAKS